MSVSVSSISGAAERNLVEQAKTENEFKLLREFLESKGFQRKEATAVELAHDNSDYRSVVTFLMTTERTTELAEIVAAFSDGHLQDISAGIDYYEGEALVKSELIHVENKEICLQSTPSASLSRPSGTTSGTACQLCQILYRAARQIVQNGYRSKSTLTTIFVRRSARVDIIQQLGTSVYQNHSKLESKRVVPHVRNNGVSQAPYTACNAIGSCP